MSIVVHTQSELDAALAAAVRAQDVPSSIETAASRVSADDQVAADAENLNRIRAINDRQKLAAIEVSEVINSYIWLHKRYREAAADRDALAGEVQALREELARIAENAEADALWNNAIDWLLNSRHTADPDIQGPFWAYVDGQINLDELNSFTDNQVRERLEGRGIDPDIGLPTTSAAENGANKVFDSKHPVMNVKELKELLETFDENWIVVLSKDGEGNGYSPLAGYSNESRYEADSEWSGELVSDENCDEDLDADEEPCDHTDCRFAQAVPAIVLWPTN